MFKFTAQGSEFTACPYSLCNGMIWEHPLSDGGGVGCCFFGWTGEYVI